MEFFDVVGKVKLAKPERNEISKPHSRFTDCLNVLPTGFEESNANAVAIAVSGKTRSTGSWWGAKRNVYSEIMASRDECSRFQNEITELRGQLCDGDALADVMYFFEFGEKSNSLNVCFFAVYAVAYCIEPTDCSAGHAYEVFRCHSRAFSRHTFCAISNPYCDCDGRQRTYGLDPCGSGWMNERFEDFTQTEKHVEHSENRESSDEEKRYPVECSETGEGFGLRTLHEVYFWTDFGREGIRLGRAR